MEEEAEAPVATVKVEAEVQVEEVMEEEEAVMAAAQAAMVAEEVVVEVHLAAAMEEEVMEEEVEEVTEAEEEGVTEEEVEEVTEEGAAGVHLAGAMEAEETAMAQETMATPHRGELKETLLTPVGPHTDPEMTSPAVAAALEGSRMTTMMTTRAINNMS